MTKHRSNRFGVVLGCLGLLYSTLNTARLEAQVRLGPQGVIKAPVTAQSKNESPSDPNQPRVRRFVVDGVGPTEPAFQYSLQIPIYMRQPGNAIAWYYRAFQQVDVSRSLIDELGNFYDKSAEELEAGGVPEKLKSLQGIFEDVEIATHRAECDWDLQVERMTGTKTIELLLAEFQTARDVARLIALKARLEIHRGEFSLAAKTLRQGYQLGRDVAKVPTLINCLIGIAITSVMNQEVAHWIEEPDAPNLYWPLAELPRSPVDIREAMQNELNWPSRMFPILDRAESTELTDAAWNGELRQMAQELSRIAGMTQGTPAPIYNEWMLAGLVARGYPRARRELLKQGFTEEQLNGMPAARVVAIFQSRLSHRVADELFKAQVLPAHESWKQGDEAEKILRHFSFPQDEGEVIPIMSLLLPAVSATSRAEGRCWSEVNQLQAMEALRAHLASTQEFPQQLTDVRAVPVPDDPITNSPFNYQVTSDQVVLESNWPAAAAPKNHSWRFEIRKRP